MPTEEIISRRGTERIAKRKRDGRFAKGSFKHEEGKRPAPKKRKRKPRRKKKGR